MYKNEKRKEKLIYACAKDAFTAVLRLDLAEGTYTWVLAAEDGEILEDVSRSYEDFADDFAENHAESGKDELRAALSLQRVRSALDANGHYMVVGGRSHSAGDGYKALTFIPAEDEGYVTIYCVDFSNLAEYYHDRLKDIEQEKYRDHLTNTFNRNYYESKLRDSRISGCAALIDVDDFKLCNDTYGHDIGDLALTETAQIILGNIREKDILIRFGGDEFLLILPGCSGEQMNRVLERIQNAVNNVKHGAFGSFRLSVSIGGVSVDNETVAEAAYRADRIMYLAKRQKNTFVTDNQLAERSQIAEAEKSERQKILIVDDSEFNRMLLSESLEGSFDLLEAADGKECMEKLEKYGTQISLVLLDVIMPKMNGFEVLKAMGEKHLLEDIPVMMITVDDDSSNIRRSLEMGATDYIHRPFDAKVVLQRVRNTVKLYAKQRRMLSMLSQQNWEREKSNRIMVDILSNVIGYINGESASHNRHVKKITMMMLERLILKTDRYGLAWKDCRLIASAAVLHDIGKVGIPPEILNKPGRLTQEECNIMKTHTLIGEKILQDGDLAVLQEEPLLKAAVEICRWHHERFDGKGYPDRLSGEEIPIAAQVVSIADAYDALVSKRAYKDAYEPAEAVRMICEGECGSFNPVLLECLSEISEKLRFYIYE